MSVHTHTLTHTHTHTLTHTHTHTLTHTHTHTLTHTLTHTHFQPAGTARGFISPQAGRGRRREQTRVVWRVGEERTALEERTASRLGNDLLAVLSPPLPRDEKSMPRKPSSGAKKRPTVAIADSLVNLRRHCLFRSASLSSARRFDRDAQFFPPETNRDSTTRLYF